MKKVILSVNAGSSSVKISVYTASHHGQPTQHAEAQISGLTSPPAKLSYTREGVVVAKDEDLSKDHGNGQLRDSTQDSAFRTILATLIDDKALTQISSKEDIAIVCHRIVHGGDLKTAQVIDDVATYHRLEELNDLAPLHNAPSLEIVKSCMTQLGGGGGNSSSSSSSGKKGPINIACFDTLFHATLPPHVRTYPIDQTIARKNGLRKYGFHGISYSFITRSVSEFLGKRLDETNIIALHLGSGASACAVKGGKSWDTSMGLTPLAGLPGATRSGSIDPSLVFHYASDVGKLSPSSTKDLHISVAETILNKESGWKALTGTTNFGTIAQPPDCPTTTPEHKLAFDLFVDRVCGFVGSYYVSLQGQVDALVFAGGIGEKSYRLRKAVVEQCACLGFQIDHDKNETTDEMEVGKVVRDISKGSSSSSSSSRKASHFVLVCQTDEQYEMAHAAAADPALWKEQEQEKEGADGRGPTTTPDLSMLKVKGENHDD